MTSLLLSLLIAVAKAHKTMECRTNALFHRDGMPDDVLDYEIEGWWKMQLPTPKPTIALGYSSGAFNAHKLGFL
jgi:hypothetical protein